MSARIGIIYYSTYGHIRTLAETIAKGVAATGAEPVIYQVPETLPAEVLEKMHAPPKGDHPVLTYDKLDEFAALDGYLFGMPSRFGMMAAQMKAFFDSTGGLWAKGALVGKPAGLFFSTGTQNGGQETVALTAVTQLVHHGMVFIPAGYSMGGEMFSNENPHGGSPYGAGMLAGGDGSRQASEYELAFAEHHGKHVATIINKLKKGSQ